jgi:hypothetical protein
MSERPVDRLRELETDSNEDTPAELPSEEYRSADPRDIVEEDGVARSGPGGTPQEGESVEERRRRDRS